MEEIGINMNQELINAPNKVQQAAVAEQPQPVAQAAGIDTELEDRLNALRKA